MTNEQQQTELYIPSKEYSPGPDMRYRMVFLKDIGKDGEMFYVDINVADALVTGRQQTSVTNGIYRQTRVVYRETEPGINGVMVVPVRKGTMKSSRLLHLIALELESVHHPRTEKGVSQ